ncbi:MAG: hypothetical protein COB17_07105 [Sulfurimonas sp.]|nr:MAG: hypothetical protein COB17_07105 [Sulfurimonas sp.]
MSLCHIYNTNEYSSHTKKILNSFKPSLSLNIDKIDDYNIYIIELEHVDKHISLKLKKNLHLYIL